MKSVAWRTAMFLVLAALVSFSLLDPSAAERGAPAFGDGSVLRARDDASRGPACDDFFTQWEVPGVSPQMLAIGGIGREMMAAMDCVEKNDIAKACRHWNKIIEVTDKLGPPYNQGRVGVETLMREHKCAERAGAQRIRTHHPYRPEASRSS
jgi:hypothetical protein